MKQLGFRAHNDDRHEYEEVKGKVMEALKDYFRPEFLNRLDEIIIFDILSTEAIKRIVEIQINQIVARLTAKGVTLSFEPQVLDYLTKIGYDPHYGARPLKRVIQSKILTPIATLMIEKGIDQGGSISVKMKGESELAFDVKKGKNANKKRPISLNGYMEEAVGVTAGGLDNWR